MSDQYIFLIFVLTIVAFTSIIIKLIGDKNEK